MIVSKLEILVWLLAIGNTLERYVLLKIKPRQTSSKVLSIVDTGKHLTWRP